MLQFLEGRRKNAMLFLREGNGVFLTLGRTVPSKLMASKRMCIVATNHVMRLQGNSQHMTINIMVLPPLKERRQKAHVLHVQRHKKNRDEVMNELDKI